MKHKKLETFFATTFCCKSVHVFRGLNSVGFIPTLFAALRTSPLARGRNLFSAPLVPQVFHIVSISFAVHAGGWGAVQTGL